MKIKHVLLSLPMVAILAGCSAKIVTYNDIFKKAKDLDQEVKDTAFNAFHGYSAAMSYRVDTKVGQVESSDEHTYSLDLVFNSENHQNDKVTLKDDNDDVIANVVYNDGRYEGTVSHDPDFGVEGYFNAMRNAAFPWNGKLEIGDLLTCHKDGNEKLLNVASRNSSIAGTVSTGNFTIRLNSPASYSDRDVKRTVSTFTVTYENFYIASYSLTYSIQIIETGTDVQVTKSINTNYKIK